MSMALIDFAFGGLTGIAGNTVYDGLKLIMGSSFPSLDASVKADDKGKFEIILQTAMEQNKEIKQQLEQLKNGQKVTFVKQKHSGSGDNVAGDKIVKG